eukprot:CAMPEP_0170554898 /NCGR_PEP_ID=MMETSP0211-20121228/12775_1 /TAXON_ID=311385 /ORGANISM="Pseudokeronopsis sp., Strain OXSARD2" /LENGTH=43 /DNA_ID= /DNA_START= /DNA_END= /DNA_ORIENTATION=
MKKIHNAYENFNKKNMLVPQPDNYNKHLVHQYSLANGLKSYKK